MKPLLSCILATALAVPALGQTTTLKNDRFALDVTTVTDAQMSAQVGFVAGEIATAVLSVPVFYQTKFRVNHVQIMWASTLNGTVAPSTQESIMVYKGSVLQSGWQLVFDSANDAAGGDGLNPQLQDGGLNDFDFTNENIIIENASKITVGLKFATATDQNTGPSVCSDRPPLNPQFSTPGSNAFYGTWPEMGITTTQWFEPRIDLGGGLVFGISGNMFIRAVIERINTCPADIGVQGGGPGQDGILDNNDFVVFISYFFTQNPIADVGRQGGAAGADTLYDNNDFVVYINQFFSGCGG